ncbi:MAG: MFS transporter [Halieaceae bacterium]
MHFLGLSLADGVKPRHMLAYLVVAFFSSGYAGALAVLQPGVLQVMGIGYGDQAMVTGMLSAMQEVVLIATMGLVGVWADRAGRPLVYSLGLLLTSAGFSLYPHAATVSELIIYRLLIAFGSAAMIGMMVTVVADYASEKDRGKANGLQGLVATFGAFIPPILGLLPAMFVGNGYSEAAAQQATFAVGGSFGVFAALVAWFGLCKTTGRVLAEDKEPVWDMLKQGLAEVRDPGIALSYGAAFISRGDLAITGAFMGLWLVQWGTGQLGMQPSEAMGSLAVPRVITVVSGAMVGSLLMGYISDRVSRVTAVSMASGLAAAVYLAIFFVSDPTADWVYFLLGLMGIAEISAFVSSQALVGQQAPAARRGAVIGFFGVSGAIGILVGTAGGGWLYRSIGPSAPFVLFGALNLAVFLWSLRVRRIPALQWHADQAGRS